MEIESKLQEVIKNLLEKVEEMEVGSEEYNAAINNVVKLIDRAAELEKITVDEYVKLKQISSEETLKKLQIETDKEVKMEQIKSETRTKKQELNDNNKFRFWDSVLTVGKIVVPLAYAFVTFKESMYFEQNDSFSYSAGKISQKKLLDPKI